MTGWPEKERRKYNGLTEEEIDAIAEKAATKALEKVYGAVGKSVLTRASWAIGTCALAFAMWLASKGFRI